MVKSVSGIDEKSFQILDQIEYELKTLWHRANSSSGATKQTYLDQYKRLHENYKKTKNRLYK